MIKTKEKDFIEIDYTGRIKESNDIFDLTSEDLAKKEHIYNKNSRYGPKIICLGEKQILLQIDKFLIDKEVGKTYNLELKPEEAFGKKDPSLIKIIPSDILIKQKINPFPGLQIQASGLIGIVRSVTGGRVTVDFNHPLAGKNLLYEIKINRIVDKDDEKLRALTENMLNLSKDEYTVVLETDKAKLALKPTIPTKAKEELKSKAKELIPSLEIAFN